MRRLFRTGRGHIARGVWSLSNLGWIILTLGLCANTEASEASTLRLIPFPKKVEVESGRFTLNRKLVLEISQDQAQLIGQQISDELKLAGLPPLTVRPLKTAIPVLRLSPKVHWTVKRLPLREQATPEDYALQVQSRAVIVCGASPAGLYYGAQTLRQLIRANRQDDSIPCMSILDWPSLRWRAFQDDLTRGPSSTLKNLEQQAGLGSSLKLNVFTYYMEHQFAFRKHPVIGPPNGSLTPEELKALVAFSRPLHLNVLGNQQSFGHFGAILTHPEFAALRETPNLLCPTNAQTYRLLDDLYSEVIPLLPFPFFNVCCDETDGLGEGPSKPLAQKIGAGGLYVQHLRRIHDLLSNKYHKRMMMWGDIILRHPDHLSEIPKDTVMLTWGYDARASFDDQIIPFAKAGYDFFVCPGVSCWNRLLPAFGLSSTNIQNFVRDGVKRGAIGMINTAWDDDGESFNAPNWYGFAWGAECAWNASSTTLEDFNRRIGPVLFGSKAQRFGDAIHSLAASGIDGMPTAAFWQFNFGQLKVRTPEAAKAHWEKSLKPIQAAITNLVACQGQACVNGELLDYFLFGAQRMELCVQREIDRLQAAVTYRSARRLPLAQALPLLEQAEATLRLDRDAHQTSAQTFAELWSRENKPYALEWTLKRYRELIAKYDAQLERLRNVRLAARPDRSLPTPREVGLEIVEETR